MKKLWFMSLRKYLRMLFIALPALLMLITISLYALVLHYGPELKTRAVHEINAYLAVPVEMEEIALSIWSHFPLISVQLKGVESREEKVYESQPQGIVAKEISLVFHPIDLIRGQYRLRGIDLKQGELNLIVFWNGSNNYDFSKSSAPGSEKGADLSFDEIRIKDFSVLYRDLQNNQRHQFHIESGIIRGKLEGDLFTAKLRAGLIVQEISLGERIYVQGLSTKLRSKLLIDIRKGSVEWEEAELEQGGIKLEGNGRIVPGEDHHWLEMAFHSLEAGIAELMPMLPAAVQQDLQPYTPLGNLKFSLQIVGKSGDVYLPRITADWQISRGSLRICPGERGMLNEVEAEGSYDSGTEKDFAGQELRINTLRALFQQTPVRGSLQVKRFDDLLLEGEVAGQFRYSTLPDCWISLLELNADADISFQGRFSYDALQSHPDHWSKGWKMNLSGVLSQGIFRDDALGLDLYGLSAAFELNPQHLHIPSFNGNSKEGPLEGSVTIDRLLAYLDLSSGKMKMRADVKAESLPLAHWIEMESPGRDGGAIWPEDLEADIQVQVQSLAYRHFRAEKVSGHLSLAAGNLYAENLLLNTMAGQLQLDGNLLPDQDGYRMQARASLQGIQISELFRQMEDFGQKDLTHKQLSGVLDAGIVLSVQMDHLLNPDPAGINAVCDISIQQGVIQDYPPLKELPRFIKAGNLDKVNIEPLRNQITIANQKVMIPEMAVNTDAMNLWISGSHSFDQQIDYSLRVLLSEVLGKRAGEARQTASEFGWIEDDGLGRTSLFIKISGTADVPIFRYDRKGVLQKIGQDIREDRKEVGKILREEFQWLKRDSVKKTEKATEKERLKKQEAGEFILEWDPDSL
jgi:hypothetical protein